jgi:hypothetical protein
MKHPDNWADNYLNRQEEKSPAFLEQISARIIAIDLNVGALEREKAELKLKRQNILQRKEELR